MRVSDEELILKTLSGNQNAFGELVRRYQGMVCGLAFHIFHSLADAEDITQEAFIEAYINLEKLKDPRKFPSWLRTIAVRVCSRWLHKRERAISLDEVGDSVIDRISVEEVQTPAQEYERKELDEAVMEAIDSLPEKVRQVITLFYMDGLSYRDIARFLDLPTSTVKGRLQMGRRQLKEELIKMVEKSFEEKKPGAEFAEKVVRKAMERARKAASDWRGDEFARRCDEVEQALAQLTDIPERKRARIELLHLQGNAAASWLGKPEQAQENYKEALKLAREIKDAKAQGNALKAMALAHRRYGNYEDMAKCAEAARAAFVQAEDGGGIALNSAMVELPKMLPDDWREGQPGGYVLGSFGIRKAPSALVWEETEGLKQLTDLALPMCNLIAHLFRTRTLLQLPVGIGTRWSEEFDPKGYFFGWPLDRKSNLERLIALTTVESDTEIAVTPAGTFDKCLKLVTVIKPKDGEYNTKHVGRSYCGKRVMWFAPGVGLVKLRYTNQKDATDDIHLTSYSIVQESEDYFPLAVGNCWEYEWLSDRLSGAKWWMDFAMFRETYKVVAQYGERVYLSNVAYASKPDREAGWAHCEYLLDAVRQMDDKEGKAILLDDLGWMCKESFETKQALEYFEELLEICRETNDRIREIETTETIEELKEHYKRSVCYQEKELWAVREMGDKWREAEAYVGMGGAHESFGNYQAAIECWEEASKLYAEMGDYEEQTHWSVQAELDRQKLERPETTSAKYCSGNARIRRSRSSVAGAGSGYSVGGHWPPGPKGSPMATLFAHRPFAQFSLPLKVGDTWSEGHNFGVKGGVEHFKSRGMVESLSESVAVPAGTFENCLKASEEITTSKEHKAGPSREYERGYFAGRKLIWFAPGVGLVRLQYHHKNGLTTNIELVDYSTAEKTDDYFAMNIGNWWRHEWTDERSGTVFSQLSRVIAQEDELVYVGFVTYACHRSDHQWDP